MSGTDESRGRDRLCFGGTAWDLRDLNCSFSGQFGSMKSAHIVDFITSRATHRIALLFWRLLRVMQSRKPFYATRRIKVRVSRLQFCCTAMGFLPCSGHGLDFNRPPPLDNTLGNKANDRAWTSCLSAATAGSEIAESISANQFIS